MVMSAKLQFVADANLGAGDKLKFVGHFLLEARPFAAD